MFDSMWFISKNSDVFPLNRKTIYGLKFTPINKFFPEGENAMNSNVIPEILRVEYGFECPNAFDD